MNFVIAAEVAGKVPGISLACMTFSALLMVAFFPILTTGVVALLA